MALQFVLEDGSGVVGATTYLTEARADQLHENRGTKTAWDAVADKELNLNKASTGLDNLFHSQWKGRRVNVDQGRDWVRFNVYDKDDYYVDATVVPFEIELATAILALNAETEVLLPDQTDPAGSIESDLTKIGPLTFKTDFSSGGSSPQKQYTEVEALVSGLIESAGRVIRS